MQNLLSNKKLWILGGVALLLFILFFIFPGDQEQSPPEFFVNQTNLKTGLPISGIFRYDSKNEEFLVEGGVSWQDESFTRYIFDTAPEGTELQSCSYFIYDADQGIVTEGGARRCNSGIVITIGDGKACTSQGEDKCFLYAKAQDAEGGEGEYVIASYHIDYTPPIVSRVYIVDPIAGEVQVQFGEEKEYKVQVADNLEVGACNLYVDGVLVSTMELSLCDGNGCVAKASHVIESGEEHTILAACADVYSLQENRYLNSGIGEPLQVRVLVNHAPEIASCRVAPTNGTNTTSFSFSVVASDVDEDALLYTWYFGDGSTSNQQNPSYQYDASGTFTPRVEVQDKEIIKKCSTAWVVVQ